MDSKRMRYPKSVYFKSEAEMQAHKARQAQARRSRREAALA
jgi:hypothetical protein